MIESSKPSSESQQRQKPSTCFLIILNALIILGLCTVGGTLVGIFVGVIIFAFLMIPSSIIQGITYAIIRKKKLNPFLRSFLYLIPCILLLILAVFGPKPPQKPNQKTPSTSPSGAYVLTVPIKHGCWTVTISDPQGNVLYKDESDFMGHFNVYWCWDAEDKVWLYNSDDGRVYFWENINGKWRKDKWGHSHTKESDRDIHPPEQVYPHYEKSHKKITRKDMEIENTEQNLIILGKAILTYANYNDEDYPTASKWCDLLIEQGYITKSCFHCKSVSGGPCNFAINPNCNALSRPNVVVLFETSPGWNQSGGQEIISTDNHNGKGCYVLFNDLHVEFVKTEDLDELIWK